MSSDTFEDPPKPQAPPILTQVPRPRLPEDFCADKGERRDQNIWPSPDDQ